MWRCEDVDQQMWGCEDVDHQMWGCEDVDQQMWRCEDVDQQMWGCEDVDQQMWGCEDVDQQMWRCEDVDQQMWGCEDVDQQMWGCEDVLQRLLFYEEPFAGALGNNMIFLAPYHLEANQLSDRSRRMLFQHFSVNPHVGLCQRHQWASTWAGNCNHAESWFPRFSKLSADIVNIMT